MGTDQDVALMYYALTGKSIKGCIPCQRKDARIELRIMAKKIEQVRVTETQTGVNGYTLAAKYAENKTYIFDRLVQLRDEADLAFWLARFPAVLIAPITAQILTPTPDNGTTTDETYE